ALDRDRLAFAELVRDAIEGGDVKILLEFSGVAKQSQEARAFRRDVLPGDPCIFNDETCAALWHHSSPVRGPVIQFDGACIRCLMNSPSVRGRQSLQGSRSPQRHRGPLMSSRNSSRVKPPSVNGARRMRWCGWMILIVPSRRAI